VDLLRTKIVCTLGPACFASDTLAQLISAGMNVARLNFSHGDLSDHIETLRRVRAAAALVGKPIAILGDLQGPKLRVGTIVDGGMVLQEGEEVTLSTDAFVGQGNRIPLQYERLPELVNQGERVLMDDGLLELQVLAVAGNEIRARVITGGVLTSNKGLNLPQASTSIPAITEKDREDVRFALEHQVDWLALSFVRTAEEVLELKGYIRELSAFNRATPVISKIEKPEAVTNIDEIIAASDGIMVARGDLGIETAPEDVPMVQKMIIRKCNQAGKPVITATQMLDSMIRNPRPTRAEVSDVANAILDGSDAIMLSGETASGKYPVLAVETMARIAAETESAQNALFACNPAIRPGRSFADAVAHATVSTAIDLKAAAIVAPTVTGSTARSIARFRPPAPIIAVTPSPMTQRQLVLYWGVYPILSQRATATDEVIADAVKAAQDQGFVGEGDVLIVTGGTVGSGAGTTNMMKVHLIERVLARGIGVGERFVRGRVRRLSSPVSPDVRVDPDEIVVTSCTDRTFVAALRRAAGLVASEGDANAHCHVLALEMGLPAVLGVGSQIDAFKDGQQIVLDAKRGLVYERPAALLTE
jgi:pyruvate kinase